MIHKIWRKTLTDSQKSTKMQILKADVIKNHFPDTKHIWWNCREKILYPVGTEPCRYKLNKIVAMQNLKQ